MAPSESSDALPHTDSGGRVRAYIGLGANVGSAADTVAAAIRALVALPEARLTGVSRLYVTRPVGVTDQADFHNAVVGLDVPAGPTTEVGATALLAALKRLERAFGRRRRARWGPRELDLDLLLFGDALLDVPRPPEAESVDPERVGRPLVVPHPEAHRRLFVLAPLADLAPDLVPPGWDAPVAVTRDRQANREGDEAVRAAARWDPGVGWIALPESGEGA